MATTHLLIVTPKSKKFEGEVELVIAPGAAGDLGALPNHAPLLTTLRIGLVKAGDVEFAVNGGFMEVLPDRVIVLTDMALAKDEVDVEAARAELKRAEEALAQKKGPDDSEERAALAWAHAKLEVAGRTGE
ncbi:MAG TPA: ATP synthase F1 subunit epsilon [Candidatus Eremiobacteraceae bacterium]|nr:ATP synthase F1 subunit epsilon [Candidatus Eremiobacteraceae bacterium]